MSLVVIAGLVGLACVVIALVQILASTAGPVDPTKRTISPRERYALDVTLRRVHIPGVA